MTDLIAGTKIRHKRWGTTGIVKVVEVPGEAPLVHVKWDGSFVDDEISEQGPVYPDGAVILGHVMNFPGAKS